LSTPFALYGLRRPDADSEATVPGLHGSPGGPAQRGRDVVQESRRKAFTIT